MHQRIEDLEAEVTKRKKAEEALKVSETRYRRLFEAAQDGIVILDAGAASVSSVGALKMLWTCRCRRTCSSGW